VKETLSAFLLACIIQRCKYNTSCCLVFQILAEQKTVHRANIFSAKYLADNDDRIVVSCSGEGLILVTGKINFYLCHLE